MPEKLTVTERIRRARFSTMLALMVLMISVPQIVAGVIVGFVTRPGDWSLLIGGVIGFLIVGPLVYVVRKIGD